MAPTTNKEQAMKTTTAQMTILYTEEIPTISHNHHDKPRRFPIIVKDGLWTAFVLSGPKGRRDTFGRLESIQRATFNDLEVALFADHGMTLITSSLRTKIRLMISSSAIPRTTSSPSSTSSSISHAAPRLLGGGGLFVAFI
jgi:hypothetical protein